MQKNSLQLPVSKRRFLELISASLLTSTLLPLSAQAKSAFPIGIIYTRKQPGKWKKHIGGHIPVVTVEGDSVRVETHHGMSSKHYIVRHTIVDSSGKVLAAKTFTPADIEPVSHFKLPKVSGTLYATSFCNKHDMWVDTFTMT